MPTTTQEDEASRERNRQAANPKPYKPGTDWQWRWLGRAQHIASWSKDPSRQVGCVLVRDQHAVAEGYNGFPHGVDDTAERLQDRGIKYELTIHAEANAVAHAARYGHTTKGCHAYVTFPPCPNCATLLVQAGIVAVIVLMPRARTQNGFPLGTGDTTDAWLARYEVSKTVFREAGVPVLERTGPHL